MGTVVSTLDQWQCSAFWFSLFLPLSQEETPSWVNICNSTYLFSEGESKSWNEASDECRLYGAHIAEIDSLAENFCLLDYAHTAGLNAWYWHGANDIKSEGVWRQNDGRLLSWSPWWNAGYNEPNGGKAENCGIVNLTEDELAGRWYDHACYLQYWYICEQ